MLNCCEKWKRRYIGDCEDIDEAGFAPQTGQQGKGAAAVGASAGGCKRPGRGIPGGAGSKRGIAAPGLNYLAVMAASLIIIMCWFIPGKAEAATGLWNVTEVPVDTGTGDQLSPSVSGSRVVFDDLGRSPDGWIVMRDVYDSVYEQDIYGPGIWAGPVIDGDYVAWQNSESDFCRWQSLTGADSCISATPSSSMALSGDIAVAAESGGGSTISRINFATGYSKKVDSHSLPGMRYDADIDGDNAVWVRMRGYGSQYYEPLIVSYDVSSDTWSYLTETGGGQSSSGESLYQRSHPVIDTGRVLYQQRLNEAGETWDIYQAQADTFGIPIVERPGDQTNPSVDGRFLVYQDNRNGHADENGEWAGDWDIYMMDLETGQEQPICTAPGDQIKPVVRDGVVVWQDGRNGDWDIYAATLDAETGAPAPDLALSLGPVAWNSYGDYLSRVLNVGYRINNSGPGEAVAVSVGLIETAPAAVALTTGLPLSLGPIESGSGSSFQLRYQVPVGVVSFVTRFYVSCTDGGGNTLWYPGQPSG